MKREHQGPRSSSIAWTRRRRLLSAALVSLALLAACGQGGRQLAGNVAGRVVTGTNAGAGLASSELVKGNSPTKHMDDMKKSMDELDKQEAAKKQPPKQSYASAGSSSGGFSPSMCKSIAEGGTGAFAFYGSLATFRLGKLMAYCRNLEAEDQETAQSSGGESSSGGCVWKGRSYGPGESIYHTQGTIRSSDLTIYGESFETLSGRSGPWQQCQCSSSSGKWGCV